MLISTSYPFYEAEVTLMFLNSLLRFIFCQKIGKKETKKMKCLKKKKKPEEKYELRIPPSLPDISQPTQC